MTKKDYLTIVEHYSQCFKKYGETCQGVDWPNQDDLHTRFQVMLDITKYQFPAQNKASLLDLGCGFGLFLDFLHQSSLNKMIDYCGIDLSQPMIDAAKKRHSQEQFSINDILTDPLPAESHDYVIMNGVLTEKQTLTNQEMISYAKKLIKSAFTICKIGIAFNVMNYHVDWQRDYLFHWAFDDMADFLTKECSRNYMVRADYGLYEYTVYLFKSPNKL